MNRRLTSSLASLAGVAAFSLVAQEADAQCQNPNGFPVLHAVENPGNHVRLLSEELRSQYNLELVDLIQHPGCTNEGKLGLLIKNNDRLAIPDGIENDYNKAYPFTNCDNQSGLNNAATPEEVNGQATFYACEGENYNCFTNVLLDLAPSPQLEMMFARTTDTNYTGSDIIYNYGIWNRQSDSTLGYPLEIPTGHAYQIRDGHTTIFSGASFTQNGRAKLRTYTPGNPNSTRETANQMTSGLLATESFRSVQRPGGGVYLMGLHNALQTPHVITVEYDPTTNNLTVCGSMVNPVVDSEGRAVDTKNHILAWRDVHDIYENTHTVGFVLNPDEEDPNGFRLFATVDLNTCNFTGCTAEETCNENTGVCERTDVNIDPCEGIVCVAGEVCIEGACAQDEEADAGADTGDADLPEDTGLDTDTETDADMGAADATDDTDLEEDSDADMADEPDAQPDMPKEDVANSDTGDADAEDPYHPDNNGNNGNNGNPDTGICTRAATECKPGEHMVNNGDECACAPIDTPDLTPDTGTDSGNNKRPPAPEPKEEGCATAPGEIQGNTKGLLFAALLYALKRRKAA
jgi:hypothetical protein